MPRLPALLLIAAGALTLACRAAAQDEGERRREAVRLNGEGVRLLEAGRFVEAIDLLQSARDLLPGNERIVKNLAAAYSHLGVDHLKSGRNAAARRAFNQATGLDPDSTVITYYRGVLALKQGDYRESVRLLKSVVERDPENLAAWESLGHAHYRLDELEATIAAWKRVLEKDPEGRAGLAEYLRRAQAELGFERISVAGRSRFFRVKVDSTRPGSEWIAAEVLRFLDDGYNKVCADLGFYPREVVTVVLYTNEDFRRVTGAHHWVAGTFDGARVRLKVRDFRAQHEAIRRAAVHELTHMVVHRMAGGSPVPAWINEGITREEADRELRRLGGADALFPLAKLERPFTQLQSANDARRAYAQSCSFTHFLVEMQSALGVGRFLSRLQDPPPGGVAAAFREVFGVDLHEAVARWRATLKG
jgi:Flp pilus assembly protein TadD